MLTENVYQFPEVMGKVNQFTVSPQAIAAQPEYELEMLVINLAPNKPWGIRQISARKLGYMRNPKALSGLLAALPHDPFWMVRCAIIQALENIGDARAIPGLQEVAKNDDFQIVQAYAIKAVERLSR